MSSYDHPLLEEPELRSPWYKDIADHDVLTFRKKQVVQPPDESKGIQVFSRLLMFILEI